MLCDDFGKFVKDSEEVFKGVIEDLINPREENNNIKNKSVFNEHISYNHFTDLDAVVCEFTKLKKLDLSYNELDELHKKINQLQRLTSLNLEGNAFCSVPQEVFSLQRLKELDLSDNQLSKLPDLIANLSSLEWLDLRNNELTELPFEITLLGDTLKDLYLEGNYFRQEDKDDIVAFLPETNIYFDLD